MTKNARWALHCAVLGSVAVASCQAGTSESTTARSPTAPPLPTASPVVMVTMREYRFDYDPAVAGGRVVFRFVNKGQVPHRPALVPLTEDIPPIAKQLRGSKRRAVKTFAGITDRRPGATGTFAVDLVAGRRYALICYARDPDGSSHAQKGMASEFRPYRPPRPAKRKQP